jgi:hypothetical protein
VLRGNPVNNSIFWIATPFYKRLAMTIDQLLFYNPPKKGKYALTDKIFF